MNDNTMQIKLKIDKEFKTLIPPLSPTEYEQLEANIIADGCREPIVIWNGYIIDGHNRYEICKKNQVPAIFHLIATYQKCLFYVVFRLSACSDFV